MKRKYTMTRIYEPLYSKLKAEAAKKGVHVSVLVNERLSTPRLEKGGYVNPSNSKMVVSGYDGYIIPIAKAREMGLIKE